MRYGRKEHHVRECVVATSFITGRYLIPIRGRAINGYGYKYCVRLRTLRYLFYLLLFGGVFYGGGGQGVSNGT